MQQAFVQTLNPTECYPMQDVSGCHSKMSCASKNKTKPKKPQSYYEVWVVREQISLLDCQGDFFFLSHWPVRRVNHNGSRVRHVPFQQSLARLGGSVQPGDADGLPVAIVGPVQIIPNPVHWDSFHIVQFWKKIRGISTRYKYNAFKRRLDLTLS